jgi:16S rRNA (guanine966-N2)-methyltransferase
VSRIIAGELGGRRLRTPPGDLTRPTSDRVREALFSRVESLLGGLDGIAALDLYAGSGAVGLEALSRGAAHAVLVESDRRAVAAVRANVGALGVGDRARVVADRVERVLGRAVVAPDGPADLVFADPPYSLPASSLHDVLATGAAGGWFADDALLVVERPTRDAPWAFPAEVRVEGRRRYGETTLWYGRREADTPADLPAETPADGLADRLADTPADRPADDPADP